MKRIVLIAIVVFLLLAGAALAGTAVLTWDAPLSNTDGTPFLLSDVKAYNIYSGMTPSLGSKLTLPITTAWPSQATMSYTMSSLQTGTFYFAVSVTAQNNAESDKSNIIAKRIDLVPGAPRNLATPGGFNAV
jgi:hypothetical protein